MKEAVIQAQADEMAKIRRDVAEKAKQAEERMSIEEALNLKGFNVNEKV